MNKKSLAIDFKIEKRSPASLSTDAGRQTHEDIWRHVQRGLVYPSPEAIFCTFFRRPGKKIPFTKADLGQLFLDARQTIHKKFRKAHTSVILGVGIPLWRDLSKLDGSSLPAGMQLRIEPGPGSGSISGVFTRKGTAFADSEADLWFHIKSENAEHCQGVLEFLRQQLEAVHGWMDPKRTVFQQAATKSTRPDRLGGKVLGCRFSENLNNATDPLTIQANTIVGLEDVDHTGASFVLAQRFYINWEQLLGMSPEGIEDLVGRTTEDILIPSQDDRGHIRCSRVQNEMGTTTPVLRLGLPFGQSSAAGNESLRAKGASIADEEGIYFAGYAKSAVILETIMDRQNGDARGFMTDRLLSNVRSDLGGIYYIPSLPDLCIKPAPRSKEGLDPARFPGVDWTRLDRHFDQRSANGLMSYNHKDYLYRMATVTGEERERIMPPSDRVLTLLADAFSRWQDNWYFDRSQQEIQHLRVYVERAYGEEEAARVMSLSVAERSGWTAKMLLGNVLVSDQYGFRGRIKDKNGNTRNGADTYRIHPAEILVGSMPNLGLGQGKYLMDFARDDEALGNFFDNLSYASGVGHIVPQLGPAVRSGLGALTADVVRRRDAATSERKKQFYAGVVLSLEGVADHCRAFARLAETMAGRMAKGQSAERKNLLAIRDRMNRLATEPPKTLVEAAQLAFTLHSCLHHSGEPTAVGRLDQILQPYYAEDIAAGRISEEEAQEIIDCFWIKLGEKVQINRQYVEDHQVFGNLAMGGSSGNYPQGSSINQWIQQVTVGGTIADGSPGAGKAAYNGVTRLCIRAARRLPLNAPCLSLRMRDDIPPELVGEAALAILSGGAHPILLSDAKIIPGLRRSGDAVGDGAQPTEATPVAEKAQGLWRSTVSLQDARDYACDGCYEPQLSGTSWFTLGGYATPQVLEAALNQGKTWQSAGPVWFRGQKISFTSEPAGQIQTYEQLEALFFQHLKWIYAKQADGQIGLFGRMNSVCPAPLLSALIDDCIPKGLDYYEGGPRYNVIGPCFTGLSTLIDSLWAIRSMVFDRSSAVSSLPELVDALRCNWGENMVEPFISTLQGPARIQARAERFRRLRAVAMGLPKFGRGNASIDAFGDKIIGRVAQTAADVFIDPHERTAQKMLDLARRLGTPENPFGGFQIQPGVGSFENYLDWGGGTGASPDGRLSGDPFASDLSPAPSYANQPVDPREAPLMKAMHGYAGPGVESMWDGAPADFNIREDFPAEALQCALMAFARGRGSSILTITCANEETMAAAVRDPEKYDLLRVRMGGWSEFFVAMFPSHQEQHRRRPVNSPELATLGTEQSQ